MAENQISIRDTDVRDWLKDRKSDLSDFAVRNYRADSWLKTAYLAIIESPDLRACMSTDQGRVSLYNALRRAASLGLSLNPQDGRACLVPYKGKIQYQVMKEGYIDLMLETGSVKVVRIGTVYAKDEWKQSETSSGDTYELVPARKDRGDIDLFYAAAIFHDGSCALKTITAEQAKEHRKKYSGNSVLGEKEYGEKTVAKMLAKTAKLSSIAQLANIAAEKDESDEPGEMINRTETGDDKAATPETLGAKLDEKQKSDDQRAAEAKPAEVIGKKPDDDSLF